MAWESLQGIIRHALTFGGGFVVAKGYVDEATMQAAIGAIITILGTAWSIFHKKQVTSA